MEVRKGPGEGPTAWNRSSNGLETPRNGPLRSGSFAIAALLAAQATVPRPLTPNKLPAGPGRALREGNPRSISASETPKGLKRGCL